MPNLDLPTPREYIVEYIDNVFLYQPGMNVAASRFPYRYTIKWEGFPPSENTQEPLEHLSQAPDGTYPALIQYEKRELKKKKEQRAADLRRAKNGVKTAHLLVKRLKRVSRDYLSHNDKTAFANCEYGSAHRSVLVSCDKEMWNMWHDMSPAQWSFRKAGYKKFYNSQSDFVSWLNGCGLPRACLPRPAAHSRVHTTAAALTRACVSATRGAESARVSQRRTSARSPKPRSSLI